MKYKYEFWIDARNANMLKIMLPEGLSIVSGFLQTEIRSEPGMKLVTREIDKILSGQEEYHDWYGNVFGAEIRKDYTRVYNHYLEDELKREGTLDIPYESMIETVEFRKLIEIWLKELMDLNSNK
jgi:hypothetical protein